MSVFRKAKGFTLIELLVVISIIGLLASVLLIALNSARGRARDARRISDMSTMQKALELYFNQFGRYPDSSGGGCGGWDTPGDGTFITPLVSNSLIPRHLTDPRQDGACGNYLYYRYPEGSYSCDITKGGFYVLMVGDMEGSGRPHPQSPGFSCGTRNWQLEGDYVIGKFEK